VSFLEASVYERGLPWQAKKPGFFREAGHLKMRTRYDLTL